MSKTTQKRVVVLLDVHAIIHRAYHALPEFKTAEGVPTGALYGLSTMVFKIISEFHPDQIYGCFDLPGKTIRHEVYGEYKGTREKTDPDLISQIKESRKLLEAFGIVTISKEGYEADDMVGTLATKIKKEKNTEVIIASGDMDTLQLVDGDKVKVYTLKKGINDTILYNEEKVVERYGFPPKLLADYKGLRGDPSDNIIGVPGIGEKGGTDLILAFGGIDEIFKFIKKSSEEDFVKKGFSKRIRNLLIEHEEDARFSKALATIHTDAPIVFDSTVKPAFSIKLATEFLEKFEFRSLVKKLPEIFKVEAPKEDTPKQEELFVSEEISPYDLRETGVALSLLDSDRTSPDLSDILSFSKKKTFKEAQEFIFSELNKTEKLNDVFLHIEKPLIPLVVKMEEKGIKVDKAYLKNLEEKYTKELKRLEKEIFIIAGEEFNVNSPKQLSVILFDKLGLQTEKMKKRKGVTRSTGVEILEELAVENEIAKKVLSYRELQKLLSNYILTIPKLVASDGRLHAKFLQNGATTGRFSSTDPNMQNIPIKTELGRAIRGAFVAEDGKSLLSIDYSQIELRVLAILSGDKVLTKVFVDDKDIHRSVASEVFGVPEDKVDAEMRRRAKVINFGIIYGMGISALKQNLNSTREEAEKFYKLYFERFPSVRSYLDKTKEFAYNNFYTETLFGRRRRFKDIRSKIPFIRAFQERMATNAPIQGTATADIIKLAILHSEEELKKAGLLDKASLLLQIHDELVYEVDNKSLPQVEKVLVETMENIMSLCWKKINIPFKLKVAFSSGPNLLDAGH
ncbi:MAG: hypothetical protein KBF62_01930 [Candidatus Pacebacteria bacterium]|nr:hypothetical protein [Candidatus Paceibacterota bacterium]MBP9058378.1 hypothetical protein [Candidatus Paceibacterota bacterium]MBP9770369.1 hypothetical protein [Candidatus Paceibacterota bacterium]